MNSSKNINPKILMLLGRQMAKLRQNPPEGIRIIPNEADLTDIQAEISGPEKTPYEGGLFRVKLSLSNGFPNHPPKGYFITKIFHPNVSKQGEICVNTLKKDWNPRKWSLKHILEIIKCLLIVPFPESSLNDEAGKLFMHEYDEYYRYAKLQTQIHAMKKKSKNKQKPDKKIQNIKKEKQENLFRDFSQINYGQDVNQQVKNMTEQNFKRNQDMTLTISNNTMLPQFKLFGQGQNNNKMQQENNFGQMTQNKNNLLFNFASTQENQQPKNQSMFKMEEEPQMNNFSMNLFGNKQEPQQKKLSKHSKKKKWLKRI